MQRKPNPTSPIAIPNKSKTSTLEICSFFIGFQQHEAQDNADVLFNRKKCTQQKILKEWLKDRRAERDEELENVDKVEAVTKQVNSVTQASRQTIHLGPVAQDNFQRVQCRVKQ